MKEPAKISVNVIFRVYSKDLLKYAFSILKNREEAEDAVQDGFRKYIENISSYKGECSIKTWLFRIVRNNCYDNLKGRKFNLNIDLISIDKTENYDKKISLECALKTLSEDENELIYLREYLGYSYKEISKILNISIENVKIRLYRTKQKLRKYLTEK